MTSCPDCGGARQAGQALPPCLCELVPSIPAAASGVPEAAGTAREAAALKCPSCGAFLEQGARRCAFCDVELAATRCWRCFDLGFAGRSHCASCGAHLELEGDLGATERACPACEGAPALHRMQVGGTRIDECLECGGVWVTPETLERLTRREALEAGENPAGTRPKPMALEPVRYRSCPVCTKIMQRQNFGRVSGVIVDVCKPHGVFFDAEELTHVLEFVARGGLRRGREREEEEARLALSRLRMSALRVSAADDRPRERGGLAAHAAGAFLSALLDV